MKLEYPSPISWPAGPYVSAPETLAADIFRGVIRIWRYDDKEGSVGVIQEPIDLEAIKARDSSDYSIETIRRRHATRPKDHIRGYWDD